MTPVIYSLPYDPTGDNPRNRVIREYHSLEEQIGMDYRVLTLDHGHFFVKDVELTDETGYNLKEEDFQCTAINAAATMDTGQEVAAIIIIVNPDVGSHIYVNASMVGGTYCSLTDAIAQSTLGLLNPTRLPTWRNVTGKPDKFDVSGHLHAMWELYGFEGMCEAIERLIRIKMQMAKAAYEVIYEEARSRVDYLEWVYEQLQEDLRRHIATQNAHRTTSTHIQLEKILNAPPITYEQSTTLGFNDAHNYLTVQGYKNMIQTNFIPMLQRHINDTNNPHRVNYTQLGVPSKNQIDVGLASKLTRGVTASSTHRVGGLSYANFYKRMREDLDAKWITSGIVPIRRLVKSVGGHLSGVTANNNTIIVPVTIRNYMPQRIRVVYVTGVSSSTAASTLGRTFTDNVITPIGSVGLCMVSYYYHRSGGGNGTGYYHDWRRLRAYIKTGTSSWSLL